jgi:hypothetical protein
MPQPCGDGLGYRKIQPELKLKFHQVSGEIISLPVEEEASCKEETCWLKINPDLPLLDTTVLFQIWQTNGSRITDAAQFNEAKSSYERNKILFKRNYFQVSWDKSISLSKFQKQPTIGLF